MSNGIKAETIRKRIENVRAIMCEEAVDVYVICTGDYHLSEYAGDYFAERMFLSGFTGSAGTLVITADRAALFVDGRYFVQAAMQIEGTGIELMRMGCAGVPTLNTFCKEVLPFYGTIGLDGRTVGAAQGLELEQAANQKKGKLHYEFNAVERIWDSRPPFPSTPVYELCVGETRAEKLGRLRKEMQRAGADLHIIASLDDICWLFNLRASDVACNPVFMSYAVITSHKVALYTEESRFEPALKERLTAEGIKIKPYEQIYETAGQLHETTVLVDPKRVNLRMYMLLCECSACGVRLVEKENPTVLMKAVKNPAEIEQLKAVHIEDGLAVTRFIFWLKQAVRNGEKVTEYTAAEHLEGLRSRISDYIEPSFETISAYNENAAMMHYHAEKDTCAQLQAQGMLLVDSGGQYLRGTTDVTRTIALGTVTAQMKRHYTLALKGMLALSDARFLQGCTGFNLDILARQPLWNEGIDYRCGTGHGVGFLLNVHESPNGFRWHHQAGRNDLCELQPGMVTSNEPGVYMDGAYGIRIENEIVCVKDMENEYGTFLRFEPLTCVPVDLELVEDSLLQENDRERLNRYHQWVFKQLGPHMEGDQLEFLKTCTRPV